MMSWMKTLVLCVDRDDDLGVKTGLNSPFIGREENIEAAIQLGIRDAEDSDINTLLAAIGIYDDMQKKGMDVEVATICGDINVGYQSDLALITELENVLEVIKPDRVILVSDGAEDEFIFPMVSSRVKIDSVKRVFVKQAPTVEGTYYILVKMLKDDKMRKRILTPIGLVLAVFGIFSLIPKLIQFSISMDIAIVSEMAVGTIAVVLGLYLIFYAYRIGERLREWSIHVGKAIRSGSQMIPFAVLSVVFLIAGIAYGLEAAEQEATADLAVQALAFINGVLWMWVFAIVSYETGKLVNHYLSDGKVYWTYLVATVSVFAIAFIAQGAMDATQYLMGYKKFDEMIIILEMITGFLLAAFGGLLNASLRSIAASASEESERSETHESSE